MLKTDIYTQKWKSGVQITPTLSLVFIGRCVARTPLSVKDTHKIMRVINRFNRAAFQGRIKDTRFEWL